MRLQVSGFSVQGSGETEEMTLSWSSVAGKLYRIEYATNLIGGFSGISQSNIEATPLENTSTVPAADERRFYRIRLEE